MDYELTIVLPGKVTSAKKKSVTADLTKMVNVQKGKLGKVDDWGEKQMAYEIDKNTSGTYLHFPLELDPQMVSSLDKKLKLNKDLIRYLIIRKDK